MHFTYTMQGFSETLIINDVIKIYGQYMHYVHFARKGFQAFATT